MKYRIIEFYVGEDAHWDTVAITGVGTQLFSPEFVHETLSDESFAIWNVNDAKGRAMRQVFLRDDDINFTSKNAAALTSIRVSDTAGQLTLSRNQVKRLRNILEDIGRRLPSDAETGLFEAMTILGIHKPVETPEPIILGTQRLIDSVWTIRGYFTPEGKVFITYYGRDDREGYDREHELPTAHLIESDEPEQRTVTGISIADRHCAFSFEEERAEWKGHAVANPGFVFGYGA